ncbi:MAG: succinate dehydrogenase / fumarate reductase membrane anchor subunit [Alcanivorax sp.]|jgi:succinate dehydrogenase / fumarate reductase membrane anchor subunit
MVTAVTSLGRSGVSDWLLQRISAVILLAYFTVIGVAIAGGVDYVEWKALFGQTWMRIFSMLAIFSLATHAWIGMWAVFTDYLTERLLGPMGNALRLTFQIGTSLLIFIYVIWAIQILWGN